MRERSFLVYINCILEWLVEHGGLDCRRHGRRRNAFFHLILDVMLHYTNVACVVVAIFLAMHGKGRQERSLVASHFRAIFEPDQCWITSHGIRRTEAVVNRAINLGYDQVWSDVQLGERIKPTVAKINPGVLDICLASS